MKSGVSCLWKRRFLFSESLGWGLSLITNGRYKGRAFRW
ncbi:hypothetical protein Z950_3068 [Sulfitobacter mediterraneus KCTC 32188]|nr:hypothetical protein Z950_3068 [Sulfitobacter mediterraneus KCTC 32188]